MPHYPRHARLVLLTQEAATDPHLVSKINASLRRGADVIITSGLLHALEPEPVLNALRGYLLARFPVRINARAHVALFTYSNGTFIVEPYLPRAVTVRIFVRHGAQRLVDLVSGRAVPPAPIVTPSPLPSEQGQTSFVVRLAPHSYRAFAVR